jgi:hypothetical protein
MGRLALFSCRTGVLGPKKREIGFVLRTAHFHHRGKEDTEDER